MSNPKSGWFAAFISQQLNPDVLKSQQVINELKSVDFDLEDTDELWENPKVQQSYLFDGKPDKKAFEQDYAEIAKLGSFIRY